MSEPENSSDLVPALGPLARLAAAMARPFETFDQSTWGLGPLSPGEVHALARDPAFAGPIERAVAANVLGPSFALTREDALGLASTSEGRLVVLLISEPFGRVEEAALLCAAAAMQQPVLRAVRRKERQHIRAALGAAAYQVATQEAPLLYPGLSAFQDEKLFKDALAQMADEQMARRLFLVYGLGFLLEIVSATAPGLLPVMVNRLPPGARPHDDGRSTAADLKQFTRLIHRRMPGWPAIIG